MRVAMILAVAAAAVLAACDARETRMAEGEQTEAAVRDNSVGSEGPDPVAVPTPTPAPSATDAVAGWAGRWTGVEGTYLDIAADPVVGPGHYRLTMQYTLDDTGTFPGRAEGETIRFQRPDGEQVLRATNGDATGLKYLAGKQDCLTVRPGEGYCRD